MVGQVIYNFPTWQDATCDKLYLWTVLWIKLKNVTFLTKTNGLIEKMWWINFFFNYFYLYILNSICLLNMYNFVQFEIIRVSYLCRISVIPMSVSHRPYHVIMSFKLLMSSYHTCIHIRIWVGVCVRVHVSSFLSEYIMWFQQW